MKSTLFSPLTLRDVTLRNRIVISPIRQYCAHEGLANDWHLVHYGKLAQAGGGMVMVETTAVEPRGRTTYGDLGLWSNDQVAPLGRIASFIKARGAVPGIKLGHAGRKAAVTRPWEGHAPLVDADAVRGEPPWRTVAPSALPAARGWPEPDAMGADQLETVAAAWEAAARRASRAGFEVLEIHCGHGYLLHEFLSPVSNLRSDAYGGGPACRRAYPLEVVKRLRAIWPHNKPLMCRISVIDGADGGYGIDEMVQFCRYLKDAGVDVIDCSSGGISGLASVANRLARGVGRQVRHAGRVRKDAAVKTMAVGLIVEPAQAEQVLQSGHADLVGIGREALYNPNWALHARERLETDGFGSWPKEYGWWLERRAESLRVSAETSRGG
ncbi:NADH:flavin oxidoreductase/NADH oxidase [Paraburkholderia dipogonis]|uniref:NADH:flavin oxidoreductase/NADH oxidase n=1 Tax=Paraburkholderia dipogonis TaxID=1211383 RepID=UPI0038BA5188